MAEVSELVVLHVLRVAGVVDTDEVARRSALAEAPVRAELARLTASGGVRRHSGALAGWSLTAEGRVRGEELLAEQLDAAGARAVLEASYEGFLQLNPAALRACSDWQVIQVGGELVVNDHADERHDAEVLARLVELSAAAGDLLGDAASRIARFGGYPPRLSAALERALAGDHEWVTRPVIDSFHTVWFELHEDLLATLGRRRSAERDDGAVTSPPDPTPDASRSGRAPR